MSFLDYRLHPLSSYLWLCYLVLLWCMNSSEFEHDLRRAFKTMLLVLKGNFDSELASYLLFLWLPHRHPVLDAVTVWLHFLENSRQMCRIIFNTLTSSETSTVLMMWNTLLAHDDFVIIDNPFDFISSRACPCYGWNLPFCFLPWSITFFYVENVARIAPPLRNSWHKWYFSPPPFFLGPRVDSNRDTNLQTILLEFCISINPIALKLMIDSLFLDCWLLNHHSNIDLAA
jgi:hypothetical protein